MGDRWSGADDGIVSSKKATAKSGVALLGMGSFVKGAGDNKTMKCLTLVFMLI